MRSGLRGITWVTDLPDELPLIPLGTQCEILSDGTIIVALSNPIEVHRKDTVNELVGLLSLGTRIRCYWPDRLYDRFSASMMLPGLSEDLQALGYEGSAIYGPDRLIWFSGNTPTSDELLGHAQFHSHVCQRTMDRQRIVYEQILHHLKRIDYEDNGMDSLTDICKSYFSCFILHHRTYTDVLLRAMEALGDMAKKEVGEAIIESLLCTDLVRWYSSFPSPLSLRKDFIEEPAVVPLPPFSPTEEIRLAEERIAKSAEQAGMPLPIIETLRNMARLSILKEWKFVLNKLITSRVAERLRRLPLDSDSLRMLTVEEVLATYRAS
jgi:hypothetical protein